MTKLTIETDNDWTKGKIKEAINNEINLLRRTVSKVQEKIKGFEGKYGELDRASLYGKMNDLELVEWEGEIDTLKRLQIKLTSLEEIIFEYK